MHSRAYALTRLIVFASGWIMAAVAALLGELMMTGVKWPIFGFAAAWWTFVCAVYVDREAEIPQNDSDVH